MSEHVYLHCQLDTIMISSCIYEFNEYHDQMRIVCWSRSATPDKE